MRQYYTVIPASAQYHGEEPLVYSHAATLHLRSIVRIPLQKQSVLGVVVGTAERPRFATKDILQIYDVPPLSAHLLRLMEWLRLYYPAPLGVTAQQVLPGGLTDKTISEVQALAAASADNIGSFDSTNTTSLASLPPLTPDQAVALKAIAPSDGGLAADTFLVHGDTGTGKTRLYIELAAKALAAGRSAIVLTPEIGLASQLTANFAAVFGNRVITVHSQLTPKARQVAWLQAASANRPVIVLGPRSALFSPLADIGLIVVDESHEPAYKQEQAPHYHAVRVASQLSALHKATLVLGSATPPVVDYYLAEQKDKKILRMRQQAAGSSPATAKTAGSRGWLAPRDDTSPKARLEPVERTRETAVLAVTTTVIDLKDRDQFGRSQYISKPLLQSIDTSLQRGEQTLLYLNRRGTARVILCNNCGWQAVCPHCDLPLTYHHDLYKLQCHTCGFTGAVPTSCPDCGNADVVFKVVGTKAIEEDVRRLYPSARIMRFDTDNKKADRFEQHYQAVRSGEVDILIGTQLLAKGLDLPRLSTLGVLVADTSLTFPDYSAEERTYQLLAQVIGRVGRGHTDAAGKIIEQRVVVQSYAPDRTVIQAALARDWDSFYKGEISGREAFYFPPFCYLLKLTCRRASSKAAEKASEQFMYTVQSLELPLLIEGPMPSFHARIDGKYEWQLVLKSRQRSALLRVIALLKTDAKSGWSYDIDPVNLL